VTEASLAAGQTLAQDNGAMDFIANATGAIFAAGWTPELQKMAGGQQTPQGLLEAVQKEYETQLAR
jgi:raffinose/stachyose/melibiose transport system substrate-binding protein